MVTRLMQGMLCGVTTSDPVTFVLALLITGAVAMVASYIPARRAARTNPASALGAD
ncbi:MAG: hypothetical protein ABI446_06660 [Gemmatimonadaceae bacterium]